MRYSEDSAITPINTAGNHKQTGRLLLGLTRPVQLTAVRELWLLSVKTGATGSSDQWNIWFKRPSVPNCSAFQLGDFNLLCGNNWEAVKELIVFSIDESSGSVGEPCWPHSHADTHTQTCSRLTICTCIAFVTNAYIEFLTRLHIQLHLHCIRLLYSARKILLTPTVHRPHMCCTKTTYAHVCTSFRHTNAACYSVKSLCLSISFSF